MHLSVISCTLIFRTTMDRQNEALKCPHCRNYLGSEAAMADHSEIHADTPHLYSCTTCSFKCRKLSIMVEHLRVKRSEKNPLKNPHSVAQDRSTNTPVEKNKIITRSISKNSTPVTQAPKQPIEALAESVQDNTSKSTVPPTYWLKPFEKRGVYVIEATHGSNKNIYHNDIGK